MVSSCSLAVAQIEALQCTGVGQKRIYKKGHAVSTCMLRIESLRMKVTRSPQEAASSAATSRQGSTSTE